jgi:V8-like Glu-specific endopeptidase
MSSSRPRISVAVVAALTAFGCASSAIDGQEGDADVSTFRPPIINGSVDSTHQAVVALVYEGEQFCSGTLIGPRTVVSAGHCLRETGFGASEIKVFFGTTVGGSGQMRGVAEAHAHPDYYVRSDGAPMNDVSVLVLAQNAPVAPMAWQKTALGNVVGVSALLVGYGVTSAAAQTGNGTRRKVTETIADEDGTFLYYGGNNDGTCQGDSGGPMFVDVGGTLTVIGVTSFGDASCVQLGASTRVDAFASFISQYLSGAAPGGGAAPAEAEPNDTQANANVVPAPLTVVGTIGSASDADWFQVTLPAGATLAAHLGMAADVDYDLGVYDAAGAVLAKSENDVGLAENLTWRNGGAATTVHVRVVGYNGATSSTPYQLRLSW